jgi:Iap family predicted aminopeptidase
MDVIQDRLEHQNQQFQTILILVDAIDSLMARSPRYPIHHYDEGGNTDGMLRKAESYLIPHGSK